MGVGAAGDLLENTGLESLVLEEETLEEMNGQMTEADLDDAFGLQDALDEDEDEDENEEDGEVTNG